MVDDASVRSPEPLERSAENPYAMEDQVNREEQIARNLAAVEIGGSWRHWETLGVLGAWAVVGLVLAPFVLRRMARRESGSRVEARRQRALQRGQ